MLSVLSIPNDDLALATEFKASTYGIDIWMVKIKKGFGENNNNERHHDICSHSLTHSLAPSFTPSFAHSLARSLTRSFTPSHPPSLTHPPTRHIQPWIGRNSAVMKSLKKQQLMLKKLHVCSLTHSLTYSPTHSLTHTLTRPYLPIYLSTYFIPCSVFPQYASPIFGNLPNRILWYLQNTVC